MNIAMTSDVIFLGLSIVLGGQIVSWNIGLVEGFVAFGCSVLVATVGYGLLCLCLSEMTSILPFAGGAYGFARVTIGPLGGYLVGCCEAIEVIFYVSTAVNSLSNMFIEVAQMGSHYKPVIWLIFYLIALPIHMMGGSMFWKFIRCSGVAGMLLVLMYCFGSLPKVNFKLYALDNHHNPETAMEGFNAFAEYLHLACWFYIGIECLPLACGDTSGEATKSIPRAIMTTFGILLCSTILLLFIVASQPPGADVVAENDVPLDYGYSVMFGISTQLATAFSIPVKFASAFGFMFCYGRQLNAMAKSGLLPKPLSYMGHHNIPYVALIAGSLVSYGILLLNHLYHDAFLKDFFNVCVVANCWVYIALFVSYVQFQYKYAALTRHFHNPAGVPSAVLGIVVFLVVFVSIVWFQHDGHYSIVIFVAFMFVAVVYYYAVVRGRQFFSEEEQTVMFSAYVINANVSQHKHFSKYIRSQVSKRSHRGLDSSTAESSDCGAGCGRFVSLLRMALSRYGGGGGDYSGMSRTSVTASTTAGFTTLAAVDVSQQCLEYEEGTTAAGHASCLALVECLEHKEDDEDCAEGKSVRSSHLHVSSRSSGGGGRLAFTLDGDVMIDVSKELSMLPPLSAAAGGGGGGGAVAAEDDVMTGFESHMRVRRFSDDGSSSRSSHLAKEESSKRSTLPYAPAGTCATGGASTAIASTAVAAADDVGASTSGGMKCPNLLQSDVEVQLQEQLQEVSDRSTSTRKELRLKPIKSSTILTTFARISPATVLPEESIDKDIV